MYARFLLSLFLALFIFFVALKIKIVYEPSNKIDPFKFYIRKVLKHLKQTDYFLANKKFSEAELNFENGVCSKISNYV